MDQPENGSSPEANARARYLAPERALCQEARWLSDTARGKNLRLINQPARLRTAGVIRQLFQAPPPLLSTCPGLSELYPADNMPRPGFRGTLFRQLSNCRRAGELQQL